MRKQASSKLIVSSQTGVQRTLSSGAGVRGAQSPLLRLQRTAPVAQYSNTLRHKPDKHSPQYRPTDLFPDKPGKAPLPHKPGLWPRARRQNAADRMRSRRKNERLLTERACTISGSSLRFILPVENTSFPQAICGNTYVYKPDKLRRPGPGRNSLAQGCRGCGSP